MKHCNQQKSRRAYTLNNSPIDDINFALKYRFPINNTMESLQSLRCSISKECHNFCRKIREINFSLPQGATPNYGHGCIARISPALINNFTKAKPFQDMHSILCLCSEASDKRGIAASFMTCYKLPLNSYII